MSGLGPTASAADPTSGAISPAATSQSASDATRLASEQDRIDAPGDAAPPVRHVARVDRDYRHGVNLSSPAVFRRYRRKSSDPLYRPLRIFVRDPVASTYAGGVTVVSVPYEPLEKGPAGSFLAVDGDDILRNKAVGLADLESHPAMMEQGFRPSTADTAFHQQMVYAVCAEVAAVFTGALGRDLSWGFDASVLKLRPHFGEVRNAYYDPDSGELRFGYFAADPTPSGEVLPGGTIYTCLSHDIIAHEMTHAVLDGMRARFHEPTNPDVLAFHEGFADLVAILLHFDRRDVVEAAIARCAGRLGMDPTIFSLAEQFGAATGMNGPLRTALGTSEADRLIYGASDEPHERGSVLVGAVLDALSHVFERRAAPIKSLFKGQRHPDAPLPSAGIEILATIASNTASQFLALCIRAIDYCPPVDIRFGEYLRALVTANYDLVEDDRDGFRQELIGAFARRKIFPDDVPDISEDSLLWRAPDVALPSIPGLAFDVIQLRPDPGEAPTREEIEREAGALADVVTDPRYRSAFGLSMDEAAELPTIESIRILRRVGPDRQVRFGLVCEVLQHMEVVEGGRRFVMIGGSTVIMDSAGVIRLVVRKDVAQPQRKAACLRFAKSEIGNKQADAHAARKTWASLHRDSFRHDVAGTPR